MAIGKEVISAYAGAADVNSFDDMSKVSNTKTHKINYSATERELYNLYTQVREMRRTNSVSEEKVILIFNQLQSKFSKDWLLLLELYEVAIKKEYAIEKEILKALHDLKSNKSYTKLIENGLILCQQ
jgi:phenylalanine-4-hydroxylase